MPNGPPRVRVAPNEVTFDPSTGIGRRPMVEARKGYPPMKNVRDVMTKSVHVVHPETPLKDVARLLLEYGISGLPVVAADGGVVGVVSEADLLMKQQGAEAVRHRALARFFGDSAEARAQTRRIAAQTAGDAMSAPPVTIEPAATIPEAAARMTARRVNRLPVVEDGRLIGIVTRADLVRAYVRSDAELADTIRDDVLLHVLWLDPTAFRVTVRNGVATVRGHVERRSTAETIERAVRMVPGVVDVRADIAWRIDDGSAQAPPVDLFIPIGSR